MLSICIPIYKQDVRELVNDLHKQAQLLEVEYEFLLVDDASGSPIKKLNKELTSLPNVRYKELEKNIGRSAIRNLMADLAAFRYLVFMDCDSRIYSPLYLKKYLEVCTPNIVCYGGRKHADLPPSSDYLLRWKYGIEREDKSASIRRRHPNSSFITFNFLIDKELLKKIGFEEQLKGYGHEDTLFGILLKKNGIEVKHIENELYHVGLENTEAFLQQTQNSIRNLLFITENIDNSKDFRNSVKLLKAYSLLKKSHLTTLFLLFSKMFEKKIYTNLLGNNPKMRYFDLYKLAYLCKIDKK